MKKRKQQDVSKLALKLAQKVLQEGEGLEELRMHEFEDDEEAHDDELTERLYEEFSADFDRVKAELSKKYGPPSRSGKKDDRAVPLNGVFRFAIWDVKDNQLFVAAHHEDRGVPIILWVGVAE